jgi:hypothetical protein
MEWTLRRQKEREPGSEIQAGKLKGWKTRGIGRDEV